MLSIAYLVRALSEIDHDLSRILPTLKSTPVCELGGRSLMEVVGEGRIDDAVANLRSISSGFVD